MTIEWLAGNRIRGTTAERPEYGLPSGSVGGWVELARTTLGSNNANINISSIPDKRYYMLLSDIDLTGASTGGGMRLGSGSADTGSNYAIRASGDGGADGAYVNRVNAHWVGGYGDTPEFYVTYIANKSDKEKLVQAWRLYGATESGAGHAPKRTEFVGKWTNTSNPLDYINYYQSGSDQYASGSELVLLGWDPEDTHTTNFWEELDSTQGSGTAELDTSSFTAKKYLWIQAYMDKDTTADTVCRFNLDTGSNYSQRLSSNGGSDNTNTSIGYFYPHSGMSTHLGSLVNMFIINNSANEKLIISHTVSQATTGAGNAPSRIELVGKWANTSSQITQFSLDRFSGSGVLDSNTWIKVWGSD